MKSKMALAPAFPTIATPFPPPATPFLASNLTPPFPTNAFWENYVLNAGNASEMISPYMVQMNKASVAFGFPLRTVSSSLVVQAFITDLILSVAESLPAPNIRKYDKLSVTYNWGTGLIVPLVRGSPYVTFLFDGVTPRFNSIHAVINFSSNAESTKYRIEFNNGQTWLIYASSAINLSTPVNVAAGASFNGSEPFSGVIRAALLPVDQPLSEATLDYFSETYPTGCDISIEESQISYSWQSESTGTLSPSELLILTLPVHRWFVELTVNSSDAPGDLSPTSLSYETIDGLATGVVGTSWVIRTNVTSIGWYSSSGISDPDELAALQSAVRMDIASLAPILNIPSTYTFGKVASRAARLALIAEEVGLPELTPAVADYLEEYLTMWFNGTYPGNSFLYNDRWGAIISLSGASDPNADYGLGMMNDHHYHYGYFLYASAVLTKLNPAWGDTYKPQIYSLLRDFMTADPTDPYFTELRNFDPYVLHSWASGLFEFTAGRNQESTSEAVNAYYAASLVGLAFNDSSLVTLGSTLARFESHTANVLWFIGENSTLYDPVFTAENRVVGVLWSNMRDSNLWFAPAADRTLRLGIQVLPITPYTEVLYRNLNFVRQFVTWALESPVDTTDQWNGFVWALQALYDSSGALANIESLTAFDEGNSKSNLLWWVFTRTANNGSLESVL